MTTIEFEPGALERPISAKPVDMAAYEAAEYPLYRMAKAEGVLA